jgi:DNA polymerase III sliding clamp (beta) subunit (PCNA family)
VFSVPQKTLKDLLGQVSFAMAVHDIRYYLNGILFVAEGKQLSLVATDGHRLAFASATLDVEVPKQEVILPRKTVIELQRLLSDAGGDNQPHIEMQFANNQAKFTLWRHGVRHQAGRGQVPRLQPRHPQATTRTASPWAARRCWPACSAPPS